MEKKLLSKKEGLVIIAISIASLVFCIATGYSLAFGFTFNIFIVSMLLKNKGNSFFVVIKDAYDSMAEGKVTYAVILLIGATTSAWFASGTVPTIMYYGFHYMQDMNFLLGSFLIILFVSVFIGTAIGTIGTVGIAILGIGRGFGIPDGILMGVIVSGAFIADKISPVSGLYNLMLLTVNKSFKEASKSLLTTLIPTIIITSAVYLIIGSEYIATGSGDIELYRNELINNFNIQPYLFLLPATVLALSFMGVKLLKTILTGLILATIFSVFTQDISIVQVLSYFVFGFKDATNSELLNEILFSGGIVSMMEVCLIVALAVALVGLLDKYQIVAPIVDTYTDKAKTRFGLIFRTGVLSSLLTIVTCDQTTGIIIPGKLLQEKYNKMNIDINILARTISDTGTIIAPLMIWNLNAMLLETMTGITALEYAPFAILCYICPLVTMIVAKFGK